MHFALVIPALNEEMAIAATLQRACAARERVLAETPVTRMSVVFVNDGSTDRTQEIVDRGPFEDVVKVHFPTNRGYGAAIQAGWQATDADLLGFIDADGTCDPAHCAELLNRLLLSKADVVLASRMSPDSRMPLVRRLGNVLFARLLGLVSGRRLTDCASGFRVLRRSSLCYLWPLPDGLHFTPTMSAICLLDPRLRIEEVPLPYHERVGRSKLSVLRDGFRFLGAILFAACCYAPLKTMLGAALLSAAGGALLVGLAALGEASSDALALLTLGGSLAALQAIYAGVICRQLHGLLLGPRAQAGWAQRALDQLLDCKRLMLGGATLGAAAAVGLVAVAVSCVAAPLPLLMLLAFLVVVGASSALGGIILRVIWAVDQKQKARLGATEGSRVPVVPARPRPRTEPEREPVNEPAALPAAAGSPH
jgi:hypothetical protein